MYEKNLTEDFRIRLSKVDMDFLRTLSDERNTTVSEVVRSIIGEYRRSLSTLEVLQQAILIAQKGGGLSNGDTETDKHDII